MFVPIFIFQFAYTGLLFKAARVSTVGKQEALSVCFQQTARYVKYHGDEVIGEEEAAIKKEKMHRVCKIDWLLLGKSALLAVLFEA